MNNKAQKLNIQRKERRKIRTRNKLVGTASRPRLSVFRSVKYISAQLINDTLGSTVASVYEKNVSQKDLAAINIKHKDDFKTNKVIKAYKIGFLLAQQALLKNIKSAIFDRGCYQYHGRVKAVAEGARDGGLII